MPRAWSTRNPCHFVWHELPFDDDSIIEHRVDHYFARVYTEPLNVFVDTTVQAVDMLLGGDSSGWEYQYTDVEDDIIRWHCPNRKGLELQVLPRTRPPIPAWALDGDVSRFFISPWPHHPWQDQLVVAFRGLLDSLPVIYGTAYLDLKLMDDTIEVASAELQVVAHKGPPEGLGTRPACRFKWRGERDDTVNAYAGNVYQYDPIPLPIQVDGNSIGYDSIKQIVDMRPTVGKSTSGEVNPEDNLIRWSCRRGRPSRLELFPEDVPKWAEDRFSLATDPRYSKPVVAYDSVLPIWLIMVDAEFELRLIDPDAYDPLKSILKVVDLTVTPNLCRIGPRNVPEWLMKCTPSAIRENPFK